MATFHYNSKDHCFSFDFYLIRNTFYGIVARSLYRVVRTKEKDLLRLLLTVNEYWMGCKFYSSPLLSRQWIPNFVRHTTQWRYLTSARMNGPLTILARSGTHETSFLIHACATICLTSTSILQIHILSVWYGNYFSVVATKQNLWNITIENTDLFKISKGANKEHR